jgi:hypothetical protein
MAEGADLTTPAESAAPAAFLQDGEVIILAVRPSGWFVLLIAWPVLAAAVCVAAIGCVVGQHFPAAIPQETVLLVCLLIAVARVLAACFQWASRLYVLTNRRVLRIRGGPRADMVQLALKDVVETRLSASRSERLFGVATLGFELADGPAPAASWVHIGRASEAKKIVDDAVRQAR